MVFYSIDKEDNSIYGIKLINNKPEKVWNI